MSKKKKHGLSFKRPDQVSSVNKIIQPYPVFIKKENDKRFIFGVSLVYLLFIFFGLWNHEMWRDELQPWLTASSCHSLSEFIDNWKVQSDTILWYTTLFLLSKITLNPIVVQVFHGLLAVMNVFLLLRYAPFSRINKIFLCFGYFLLFEYGIIARGYGYTIFFLFLFCVVYQNTPKRHVLLSVILVLLANATGGYGMVLAGSLSLVLLSRYFFDKNNRLIMPGSFREIIPIVLMIGIGLWFAMKSITPPADSVYTKVLFLKYDASRFFLNIWRSQWAAFVTIPDFLNFHFWNKNFFIEHSTPLLKNGMIAFAFIVLVYSIIHYSTRIASMFFYLSSTIGMLFFSYINDHIFIGFYTRHYGFLFVVFVVSAWLYLESSGQKKFSIPLFGWLASKLPVEKWLNPALTILFAFNCVGGVIAYSKDMVNPFSTIRAASKYILDHRLGSLPTTGFIDYAISPIAAYTRKPIYYPDRDTTSVFVIWTISKYTTDGNQIIPRMMNFISKQPDSVLVVLNFELNSSMIGDVQFSHLATFKESIVSDEALSLYIAQKFDINRELNNLTANVKGEDIAGYVDIAIGLLQQGKSVEAERILNKIQKNANEKNIRRFHNCMGLLYMQRSRFNEAQSEFQKEIDLGLNKEEAYFQLGMVHYQLQKIDSALFCWEEVLKINPSNVDAISNTAVVYFNFKKDNDKAQQLWEKAVSLNPRYFQVYANLMMICQNKKDDECLLKYLRSAMANGMSLEEIRSKGIVVSDALLQRLK